MKLHRHVALVEVNDPTIIDALEATDGWEACVLRRIGPAVVAIQNDKVEEVVAAVKSMGYLPRVIER